MDLQPTDGRRHKKLIWALEAQHAAERLTCNACNKTLRRRRGCRLPGLEVEEEGYYRARSPRLVDMGADRLNECPVGMVVREAPYLYDAIAVCGQISNGGETLQGQTEWLRRVYFVWSAEQERYMTMKREHITGQSDSDIGLATRRGYV